MKQIVHVVLSEHLSTIFFNAFFLNFEVGQKRSAEYFARSYYLYGLMTIYNFLVGNTENRGLEAKTYFPSLGYSVALKPHNKRNSSNQSM